MLPHSKKSGNKWGNTPKWGNKMTFYEYMQTQLKRQDLIGSIAASMSVDVKLFPSMNLKDLTRDEWQRRICDKVKTSMVRDYISAAFDEAVKEWGNEQKTTNIGTDRDG